MAIASNTNAVIPYIGNNSSKKFPITFPTFEKENIEVEVSDAMGNTVTLEVDVEFTLENIGKPNLTGQVDLVNMGAAYQTATGNLKTGYTIFIKFAVNPVQPMRGTDWGAFAPAKIERTLDRLTMNIAAIKSMAGKALALQTGDGASPVLPPLLGNAGKIVQVNTTETGFEYGVTADQIETWKSQAQTAKNDAVTAKELSEAARDTTQGYVTTAQNAANDAASQSSAAFVHKNAAESAASGAASSQSAASSYATDAEAAKNLAFSYMGQTEVARDAAIQAANDTSQVEAYKIATEAARDLALDYKDETIVIRNEALTFRNEAIDAANDADAAMVNAETAMINSEIFAGESENAADQSELFSRLNLYAKKITITHADSPFTVDDDLHEDMLIIVDDTLGNVVINLPAVSETDDQATWKVGFMKKGPTGNSFTILPSGLDTIAGNPSVVVDDQYLGLLVYPGAPTTWTAKYFISVIAADGFVLSGSSLNFGNPGVDGTWRLRQDSGKLKFEQRQLGEWIEADVLNPPVV